MKIIVIPEDDLKRLERRFGPDVRRMGSWNSDGVFGYLGIPFSAVESAAEAVCRPGLPEAVSRLQEGGEPPAAFLELVEAFGPDLIGQIKAAYLKVSAGPTAGRAATSSPLATARQAAA